MHLKYMETEKKKSRDPFGREQSYYDVIEPPPPFVKGIHLHQFSSPVLLSTQSPFGQQTTVSFHPHPAWKM